MPKLDWDEKSSTSTKKETDNDAKAVSTITDSTMKFDPQLEPLLRENPRRFVIFPIQYEDIWQMYKKVIFKCQQFVGIHT